MITSDSSNVHSTTLISCIVVTYNPQPEGLLKVLESIYRQASRVYVIDNSTRETPIDFSAYTNLTYVPLGRNIGVAAAQNIGIREAQKVGAQYVWLSDQDTVYPENFIKIVQSYSSNFNSKRKIAAIAPSYFDETTNSYQAFTRHAPFTKYFSPQPGINNLSHCIASGSVIPLKAIDEIGLMQENLFIDMVDLEWCWRARNIHGYEIIGIGENCIHHAMGDIAVNFRGKKISFRSEVRHYYIIRNSVYLSLYSRSPNFLIRVELLFKALAWVVILPLKAPIQKTEHLKATVKGFLHGCIKNMKQYQSQDTKTLP